jgi:hypothetical protein
LGEYSPNLVALSPSLPDTTSFPHLVIPMNNFQLFFFCLSISFRTKRVEGRSIWYTGQKVLQKSEILPLTTETWGRCYDFLNIFAEKFSEKSAFLTQNRAKLCKNLTITLVFEENANFSAENCQKSPKIGTITSTPDSANV